MLDGFLRSLLRERIKERGKPVTVHGLLTSSAACCSIIDLPSRLNRQRWNGTQMIKRNDDRIGDLNPNVSAQLPQHDL